MNDKDLQSETVPSTSRFWTAVDWFIPPQLHEAGEDELQRTRLVVVFTGVLVVSALAYALTYAVIGSMWNVVTLTLGASTGPWILLLLRRTGSRIIAANLALGVSVAVLTSQTFALGGPVGPTPMWLLVVPLLAMTMLGLRYAVWWTAGALAILTGLLALHLAGYEFRNDVAGLMSFWMYKSTAGLILAIYALTHLYESIASRKTQQLREETQYSQTAVDSLPGLFYVVDERGRLQRWNRSLEQLVGIHDEQLRGMLFIQAPTMSERKTGLRLLRRVLNEGELTFEYSIRTLSGKAVPHYFVARRITIDGRPHIIGTALDISERKQADEARRRSEERLARSHQMLQLVLDTIPVGVFWKDSHHKYMGCNELFARIAGRTCSEEIVGLYDTDMPWADNAAHYRAIDREVINTGQPKLAYEEISETDSGAVVHFKKDKIPLFDPDGNVFGLLGIYDDITERKRAAAAVEESERKFRNIVQNSPMGFYLYELNARGQLILIEANPAAEQHTGIDGQALIGQPIEKAFPALSGSEQVGRMYAAAREGHPWHLTNARYEDERVEGYYDLHVFQASPGRVAVMFLDVTDRFRAEEELRKRAGELEDLNNELVAQRQELVAQRQELTAHQTELNAVNAQLAEATRAATAANRTKSEFLANMSHEIRTPMTAIMGFADVILESESQVNGEVLEAADTIRRNGEYLLSLINEILDLSKIEAGKFRIEHSRCSPCRIVNEVAALMRPRAADKNLALHIIHATPVPEMIRTDPLRLKQILINLVGNAIKFTELGSVEIISRFVPNGDAGRMEFDVVDTGIGMTAKQIRRLFQPFEQADSSTSRKFGGTGLGLTVSKRIAEILGGDVTIVESRIGEGSRFRVAIATGPVQDIATLPQHQSIETTEVPPAENMSARNDHALDAMQILLAEDGPDNQRLISHILRKAGAEVVLAENGQIAVELVLDTQRKGRPFDVVLMDMQMPVMDGYEATALLRWQGYSGAIVALTAHAMAHDREKCLNAGCDDYASKPVQRDRLIRTICDCLASQQPDADLSEPPAGSATP